MGTSSKLVVCIGRFQPFHAAHLQLIEHCLRIADHLLVVIGSAYRAATPRNPFSWQVREQMLRESLRPDQLQRISMIPLRDYFDLPRWAQELHFVVEELNCTMFSGRAEIAVAGAFEQRSVNQLPKLRDWRNLEIPRVSTLRSSAIRESLFGSAVSSGSLIDSKKRLTDRDLSMCLPAWTMEYISNWRLSTDYRNLADEWLNLQEYKQSWQHAPFPPVFVTADCVVECEGRVLLVQRGKAPGKGLWALPGGFIDTSEPIFRSALRELKEETCIDLSDEELIAANKSSSVCDHPNRSERGRVITHAFHFDLGNRHAPAVQAADDAKGADWIEISSLTKLEAQFHDDHFSILDRQFNLLPRRSG